jgi:hypothetical protein
LPQWSNCRDQGGRHFRHPQAACRPVTRSSNGPARFRQRSSRFIWNPGAGVARLTGMWMRRAIPGTVLLAVLGLAGCAGHTVAAPAAGRPSSAAAVSERGFDPARIEHGPDRAEVGRVYPFDLLVHCTGEYTGFGGYFWRTDTPPGDPEPTPDARRHRPLHRVPARLDGPDLPGHRRVPQRCPGRGVPPGGLSPRLRLTGAAPAFTSRRRPALTSGTW